MTMPVPYDLTLADGTRRELYGPWRVDAAAELIGSLAHAGRSLRVADRSNPRMQPYGEQIDPRAVVEVRDRNGIAAAIPD